MKRRALVLVAGSWLALGWAGLARAQPAIGSPSSDFVANLQTTALMSYSSNLLDQVRRSAHLADKVLRGTRPAVIPIERPTKFELVINRKTATALGISIPQSVLLQASRVIE